MINKSIEIGYLILPPNVFGRSVTYAGFVCIDSLVTIFCFPWQPVIFADS